MFHYLTPPLTKIRDNFLAIGPFFMFLGAFERHGHAAHYAFNFIKKYLFFEKLEPKTFCCSFFITRFSRNIFERKKFWKMWKSRKRDFEKNQKIWKHLNQLFSEKYFLEKHGFFKKNNPENQKKQRRHQGRLLKYKYL